MSAFPGRGDLGALAAGIGIALAACVTLAGSAWSAWYWLKGAL